MIESLGYPPLCEIVLGFQPKDHIILVTDPQEVEDIMTRRTQEFDRSDATIEVFSAMAPTAQISLETNAMWKHHRRVMGPTMTSASVKRFAPRASTNIAKMVELWKIKAKHGLFDPRQDFEVSPFKTSQQFLVNAFPVCYHGRRKSLLCSTCCFAYVRRFVPSSWVKHSDVSIAPLMEPRRDPRRSPRRLMSPSSPCEPRNSSTPWSTFLR